MISKEQFGEKVDELIMEEVSCRSRTSEFKGLKNYRKSFDGTSSALLVTFLEHHLLSTTSLTKQAQWQDQS